MYKADITSTTIKKGVLTVNVSFYSEEDSFEDTFETNQYQDEFWISEQIERKLNHLNSLFYLKDNISIGQHYNKIKVKSDKDIYYEKASLYTSFMDTARLGFIPHDRAIIVELREWLRNNFKDEYILG